MRRRGEVRVRRHEGDRVVSPGIGQAERRQVPLIDRRGERHQFDGVDADPHQMVEDGWVGERRDGSAEL